MKHNQTFSKNVDKYKFFKVFKKMFNDDLD